MKPGSTDPCFRQLFCRIVCRPDIEDAVFFFVSYVCDSGADYIHELDGNWRRYFVKCEKFGSWNPVMPDKHFIIDEPEIMFIFHVLRCCLI